MSKYKAISKLCYESVLACTLTFCRGVGDMKEQIKKLPFINFIFIADISRNQIQYKNYLWLILWLVQTSVLFSHMIFIISQLYIKFKVKTFKVNKVSKSLDTKEMKIMENQKIMRISQNRVDILVNFEEETC